MDGHFFRSYWNQPSRPSNSPSFRGIPVQPAQRKTTTSSPKVVSVPVHFVGSETTRSAAALKIQKGDTVDLIRWDAKERLRVNESLMALLFKLDSVRGVDSGVRDCRKAVIKKAIALQERVDAIVTGDQIPGTVDGTESNDRVLEVDDSYAHAKSVQETLEIKDSVDSERAADQTVEIERKASNFPADESIENQTIEIKESVDSSTDSCNASNQTHQIEGVTPSVEDPGEVFVDVNCTEKAIDKTFELHCPGVRGINSGDSESTPGAKDEILNSHFSNGFVEPENCEKVEITDVEVDSEVEPNEEACVVKQMVEDHNTTPSLSECFEASVNTIPTENQSDSLNPHEENASERQENKMEMQQTAPTERELKYCLGAGERDDNKSNRDLLERMLEDNEKMMRMMTQLSQRNEMQTRMLSSLTHRVEQLERAFICDRLRRKKKTHTVGTVDH
ncbi:hypothetical protein F0562_033573 [Nyssa sinensis]|uniref:BAG domain-containing protein n=1 Tax=Nyssa sinensis TaxID=561372 RepID=A0A5J5AFI8_9ASTE|nr:hypothetical protein F0562_033573 [Nyssa sinensis]